MKQSVVEVEVRYKETDQMGVVHHSNYLVWFEIARTRLFKELGFEYAKMEETGYLIPVTAADLAYKHPAKYGETVTVTAWIESYNGIRIVYGYEVKNQDGIQCVTGTTTHVCVKKENFKPIPIRKHLPAWHEALEQNKRQ
ncbi:MAG TPA: acyl-CoA thioesterase [Bacilli bacterium]|nr:acyl-CoA thioesterase [Bacilli bacterium]